MERLDAVYGAQSGSARREKSDGGEAFECDLSAGLRGGGRAPFCIRGKPALQIFGGNGRRRHRGALDERARDHSPARSRVAELIAGAARKSSAAEWEEFVRLGQELSDCLLPHVRKEEMALLPLIEENMDGETEVRLYGKYVENVRLTMSNRAANTDTRVRPLNPADLDRIVAIELGACGSATPSIFRETAGQCRAAPRRFRACRRHP